MQEGTLRKDPWAVAGVESSLRVTCCRQILQNLPEHNYAILQLPHGLPARGEGQASAQADQAWVLTSLTLEPSLGPKGLLQGLTGPHLCQQVTGWGADRVGGLCAQTKRM